MACCLPTAGAQDWEWCQELPGEPAVDRERVSLPEPQFPHHHHRHLPTAAVRALSPLLPTTVPRGSRVPVSQMGKQAHRSE